MEICELKGYESLRAYNAYRGLLAGAYVAINYVGDKVFNGLEDFYSFFEEADTEIKRKILTRAVAFVALQRQEMIDLISMAKDPNGVRYGASQINSMNLQELFNIIIEVSLALSSVKVFF